MRLVELALRVYVRLSLTEFSAFVLRFRFDILIVEELVTLTAMFFLDAQIDQHVTIQLQAFVLLAVDKLFRSFYSLVLFGLLRKVGVTNRLWFVHLFVYHLLRERVSCGGMLHNMLVVELLTFFNGVLSSFTLFFDRFH